jgi:hypothetical protein
LGPAYPKQGKQQDTTTKGNKDSQIKHYKENQKTLGCMLKMTLCRQHDLSDQVLKQDKITSEIPKRRKANHFSLDRGADMSQGIDPYPDTKSNFITNIILFSSNCSGLEKASTRLPPNSIYIYIYIYI